MELIEDEEPYEDVEPYEDEELLEEDLHEEHVAGDPSDSSPYPNSSSYGDGHPETQQEDTL